jgi:hypothetical protein
VRTWTADSAGSPAAAWALISRPQAWPAWAPHIRGAWNLGDDEVRDGARGAARLLGVVPIPARIVGKEPGRSWTWRVGVVEMAHRVTPRAGGCTVAIDLRAPGPLEPALALTYGPVIALALRRLARRAETSAAGR